jgi:hypothetical protein
MSDADAIVCANVSLCTDGCAGLGILLLHDPLRSIASAFVSPMLWDSCRRLSDDGAIACVGEAW